MSVIIEMSKCIITLKIKSRKVLLKDKFANPRKFQPSKYSGYTVIICMVCVHVVILPL